MNQKRKNAFTLIELLAVIVILAIIALIAVPVIMNIINKANKSAFKDTAYGILSAGELYFAEQQLDVNGMSEDITITLPDTTKKLELKGEVPEGEILITKDGKIALFIKNNRYCVTKGLDDKDITVTEDVENCTMPAIENKSTIEWKAGSDVSNLTTIYSEGIAVAYKISDYAESIEYLEGANLSIETSDGESATGVLSVNQTDDIFILTSLTENFYAISEIAFVCLTDNFDLDGVIIPETGTYIFSEMADTMSFSLNIPTYEIYSYENGIMQSTDNCINEGICESGTPIKIAVNNTETHKFYVVKDTGTELTLIMDRNLGNNVAWYANAWDNSYGPTTAVAALKERTADWTNIPEKEYTYSDDGGGNKYTAFTETMRARMLTYTEATTTLGCTTSYYSCPSWLYENLSNSNTTEQPYGYWTSAAHASSGSYAPYVSYAGNVHYFNVYHETYNGLRPVIELSK